MPRKTILAFLMALGLFTHGVTNAQNPPLMTTQIQWSPDGQSIGLGNSDGDVYLLDVDTENRWFLGKHQDRVLSMAWCGSRLATGGGEPNDNSVWIWDANSRQPIRHLDPVGNSATGILSLAWVQGCSQIIAAPIEDKIHIYNVDTGEIISTFSNGTTTQIIWDIGEKAVFSTISDILIRDKGTFQVITQLEKKQNESFVPGQLVSLALNPAFNRIAAGTSSGKVVIWDVDTTEVLSVLEGNEYNGQDWLTGFVLALRFSDDGQTLSSISGDGTYRVWDVATQTIIEDRQLPAPIYAADWSPDGTKLAYGGANGDLHFEVVVSPTPTPLPTVVAPPHGGGGGIPACPDGGGGEWVWIDGVPVFVCGTLVE